MEIDESKLEMTWMYLGCACLGTIAITSFLFFKAKQKEQPYTPLQFNAVEQSKEIVKSQTVPVQQHSGIPLTVYFGSQTGTAESFSDIIVEEGRKHGFNGKTVDLEDFDADKIVQEKCAIFMMATYGEGVPTDNAVQFISWVKNKKKELEKDALKNVNFTVFGLGNRQYEHYNAMGKLVNASLEKLGGKRVFMYGEGDDDGSLEEDFETWKEGLWPALQKTFLASDSDIPDSEIPEIQFRCTMISNPCHLSKEKFIFEDHSIQTLNKHYFHSAEAKVIENRELRQSNSSGSTIHMEIDIKSSGIEYCTADNLAVLPENDQDSVQKLAQALGYHLDQWFKIDEIPSDKHFRHPFPTPCTIKKALSYYCDINGLPRRNYIQHLIAFATDPKEKEKLTHLSSKGGLEEYNQWVVQEKRTIAEVIQAFSSIKIPLANFIDITPSLQPRYYTISSANTVHEKRIHITVSVIQENLKEDREFRGVCSNFLARLLPLAPHNSKRRRESRPGDQGKVEKREWPFMRVYIRPSTFRLPKDPKTPIVMVGPGTGIAPMRAFLQERHRLKQLGEEVGKTILYFGCRRKDEDFIYKDEINEYLSNGTLTECHLAFSREQENKVYVQHLIQNNGKHLWKLLDEENCYFFVCGSTSMGHDVMETMVNITTSHGSHSEEEAVKYIKEMQNCGRYIQELW